MNCRWPACPCKSTGVYCSEKINKAKSKPRELKRTPIKKVSAKGKIKKIQKSMLVQTDMAFYLTEIWENRAHICFETNCIVPEPLIQNFHHVLEKGPYPQYRHKTWNILIVSWETHDKIHKNIDNTPRVKQITKELIKMKDDGLLETLDDSDIFNRIHNY